MKALIKKDVYLIGILGHFLVFGSILFYNLFLTFFFSRSTRLMAALMLTGMSFLVLTMLISLMNKDRSNGEATLNSLPLEKEKIVLGRYLTILMYTAIVPFYIYLSSHLISLNTFMVGDKKIRLSAVFVAIAVLTIINSASLLIYYGREDDSKKVEVIGILVFTLIMVLGYKYSDYLSSLKILQYLESFNIVLLLFFVFSIIIYGASFNISKKIYKKKEF